MAGLYVEKSIDVHTPAARVWEVLTTPTLNKQWIEQFWPGFIALDADWRSGGTMQWKSSDGDVEGRILEIVPRRLLQYTFTMPQDIVTLALDEDAGRTLLTVRHGDFADKPDGQECYQGALAGWEMNLSNIKALAELGRLAGSTAA
jgi:uncharacterized protein YndB with AHSA1/START domain